MSLVSSRCRLQESLLHKVETFSILPQSLLSTMLRSVVEVNCIFILPNDGGTVHGGRNIAMFSYKQASAFLKVLANWYW
jgi:hypothetical protein